MKRSFFVASRTYFRILAELSLIAAICIVINSNLMLPYQSRREPTPDYIGHFLNNPLLQRELTGLTINEGMQDIAQKALRDGIISTSSKRGLAIVIDANSGAIRAMTSLNNPNPSICPMDNECGAPDQNIAVSAWEPGSVMKPLLMAAALNEGIVTPQSQYYDQGYAHIKERIYINAHNYPPQTMTMQDILSKSLNTGAVYLLKSLGAGSINEKARATWYDYLINHYRFGQKTGVEIPDEAKGEVRPPSGGRFIETQYAGSAFGVGLTLTPLQLTYAYAAIVNGGTYYQPYIMQPKDQTSNVLARAPTIVKKNVVSEQVSLDMRRMLEAALAINNAPALRSGYGLGGKSGTAPVPEEDEAYKINGDAGTYMGFLGKDKPEYIVLVRLDEPHTTNLTSKEAGVVWAEISNRLIDNNYIQ